jgi:stage V sporulation protein B
VGNFIRLLAPLIPIMYLDAATDALLKGLGEQVYSMRINILDAFISVICVALLVPRMGIMGYLLTIYITEILNAALSITRLFRVSNFSPRVEKLVFRPLLCAIGATCTLRLFLYLVPFSAPLVIRILLGALFYLLLLIGTNSFGKNDTKWLFSFLKQAQKHSNTP